jgi:hypothetical protein
MGLIKKLTGQNLNNMTDEQLQQDIYPVTSIKAIYNEFNERLDCILRRQADYNLSLKKAGTTKYSEIVTYPTLSDALSIFTQGTNTYGDATYFGLQDYGTTISFLDNNLNKWRLFKFKFTGGTLTDAEWNNVSNWEELSMSSDDIDELRKLITALQNSLAETNQNVSSLSTAVTNLQVKEQELDDKKVDKYSTSHYYDITTSCYSYDLQRVVSVPTNDGTYGAVDFTFMGHSGYTEYNDLLMMSTDESEKVVSLMTDLFYTLVENINGKEYVTLCTVNKANPRNLFQFNIDLNKFGSTYNKGVTTTGSDRPDVKNFIWYDNDNTDGRDLKLSDIQTAIAAGDYSKYVALKKGLVIKSSFEDTTLDSKTSCILTISSTDDTAKYKAADLVQYTDFIVKWDNTTSKGNLSTFKMQAHTVTETDSSGNQTTSTSYYDASKIYRFSPTSNMNGFTLIGPKDPTNTEGNDSVTLLTYANPDTKNVIPAGSIVTLTPPATSADAWLIDVKKPDVYNVDSSIDIEYDEDGRTRISRDTLIVPFNLPEFASSIPTDLKDKYVAVLKMPYNYSTFRALIGVSIQEGNSPDLEPQGGTVHLMFRRGNDLHNSHCFYYGIKSTTSTGFTDDGHMDRICFRFADANGDIIDISDTGVVPSAAKYVYLCICFLSTKGGYVDHFQFSLDQVPYGTSYQGWDYGNMLSIGLDDYIKSYVTPFTMLDATYLVPMDNTRITINMVESDLNLKIQTLQNNKQDKLTWDTVPTKDSTNDINSGAVYTAIVGKQDKLSFDDVPTKDSLNVVYSKGIYSELLKKAQVIGTDTYSNFYTEYSQTDYKAARHDGDIIFLTGCSKGGLTSWDGYMFMSTVAWVIWYNDSPHTIGPVLQDDEYARFKWIKSTTEYELMHDSSAKLNSGYCYYITAPGGSTTNNLTSSGCLCPCLRIYYGSILETSTTTFIDIPVNSTYINTALQEVSLNGTALNFRNTNNVIGGTQGECAYSIDLSSLVSSAGFNYKGAVSYTAFTSISTAAHNDCYLVLPDSTTSTLSITTFVGNVSITTPTYLVYVNQAASTGTSGETIPANVGWTILSNLPSSGGTTGSVTLYNYYNNTRYNAVTASEFEVVGHHVTNGGIMIGDYTGGSSAAGLYSLTMGTSNTVTSQYGIALGNSNNVQGAKGIASGQNNKVYSESGCAIGTNNLDGSGTASFSFNFGSENKMYAQYSFNFGYGNTNNSQYSFNFGYQNTNSAMKSYLFGDNNTNGGEYSLLFGFYNTIATASNYGTAIGYKNIVNAVNSVAIGFQNTANYWGSSPTEASWAFGSGLTSGGNYGQFALGKYNAEIAADVAFAFGFGSSSAKKTIATIRTDGGLKLAGGLTRVPKYLSTYDLSANSNKVYLSAHYEAVKITNGTTLAGVETSNGTVYSPGESVVIMGTFSYTANSVTTSVTSGAMVFVYNGSAFVKVS